MAEYEASKGKPLAIDARSSKCVPWIRLQRDPRPYETCVAKFGKQRLNNARRVYEVFHDVMDREETEIMLAIFLGPHHQIRGVSELARGGRGGINLEIVDLLRIGVLDGASACIIAHNHPSGDAMPSPEDEFTTGRIRDMSFTFFGKKSWLLDHVVFGDGQFYSFADNGWTAGGKVERVHAPTRAAGERRRSSCGCAHTHPAGVPVSPCAGEDLGARAPFIAIAVDGSGQPAGRWPANSQKEAMHKADANADKTFGVAVRHAYTSDGRYAGPGGGRLVAQREPESGRWLVAVDKTGGAGAAAAAEETVTAAYDAGGYATNQRDPKEVERGRALGTALTPKEVYDLVAADIAKESQEVFLVLPVDLRGQLLCRPVEIARGQRDRVAIDPADVFRPVVAHNAKAFIVVHCHPSGHARPSPADRRVTQSIETATPIALGGEVAFLDHVIVASTGQSGEYYSFRENVIHKVGRVDKRTRAA